MNKPTPQPQETLIAIYRLHWISIVSGALSACGLLVLGLFLDHAVFYYFPVKLETLSYISVAGYFFPLSYLSICFGVCALVLSFCSLTKYFYTQVLLTNKQLIYQRGFISVDIDKINLTEISAERIDYGLFGYILNYGRIYIDCRFIHDISIPAVRNPLELSESISKLKSQNCDHFEQNI